MCLRDGKSVCVGGGCGGGIGQSSVFSYILFIDLQFFCKFSHSSPPPPSRPLSYQIVRPYLPLCYFRAPVDFRSVKTCNKSTFLSLRILASGLRYLTLLMQYTYGLIAELHIDIARTHWNPPGKLALVGWLPYMAVYKLRGSQKRRNSPTMAAIVVAAFRFPL